MHAKLGGLTECLGPVGSRMRPYSHDLEQLLLLHEDCDWGHFMGLLGARTYTSLYETLVLPTATRW